MLFVRLERSWHRRKHRESRLVSVQGIEQITRKRRSQGSFNAEASMRYPLLRWEYPVSAPPRRDSFHRALDLWIAAISRISTQDFTWSRGSWLDRRLLGSEVRKKQQQQRIHSFMESATHSSLLSISLCLPHSSLIQTFLICSTQPLVRAQPTVLTTSLIQYLEEMCRFDRGCWFS